MCIAKPKLVARFLLALTLVAGAVGVARQPEPTAPAAQPAQKPQAQSQPEEKAALRWSPGATLDREDPDGTGASAVALSPDGKWALTGHDNGKLRLCNALTGTELEVLSGQPGKVWAIRFIRDGQAVVSVSETGVRWWALPGGKLLTKSPWSPGKVQCLAVSGDGRTVAAGIGGGKVLLHDLDDKSEDVSFQVHQGLVMALAWSTDGKTLATGGGDATVRLWDVRSRRDPVIFKGPGKAMVRGVAFAPDGKLLASAHGREGVVLRDVKTAKELRVLQGQGQTYTAVAFAPDGKLLATGTANGTVRLWNLDTGRPRATFKEHAGQIHTLTFGADGKMLASVSFDGTVRLWRGSTPDGKEPEEPKVTARELDILLADLRGTDETRAVQAARSLAVLPRQGVELLKGQLRPVKAASSDRVARF